MPCLLNFVMLFGLNNLSNIELSLSVGNDIARIASIESSFQSEAVSSANAKGVMQLTPIAVKEVYTNVKCRNPIPIRSTFDYFNPIHSVMVGACYYQHMLTLAKGDRVLAAAAYNAGPSVITMDPARWPTETKVYVQRFEKIQCY